MSPPLALARGLRLLELVASAPAGCTFGELTTALELPNTTVARLVSALGELGYLEKEGASGRYRQGAGLRALRSPGAIDDRLRQIVEPRLPELRDRLANTVLLIAWDGAESRCLARAQHPDSVVMQEPGYVSRMIFEAPWGVFCLDQATWQRAWSARRRPLGVSRARYQRERRRLAEDGWCRGDSADKRRLAAPITAEGARIVGALVVGGTAGSLSDRRLPIVGRELARCARACSRRLGG